MLLVEECRESKDRARVLLNVFLVGCRRGSEEGIGGVVCKSKRGRRQGGVSMRGCWILGSSMGEGGFGLEFGGVEV